MIRQDIEKAIEYFNNATVSFASPAAGVKAMKIRDLAIEALQRMLNNGWIPVTERLPEESIDGITDDFVSYNVSLKFDHAECTRTYKFGRGKWWNEGTDMTKYVIAWRQLPDVYILPEDLNQQSTCKS